MSTLNDDKSVARRRTNKLPKEVAVSLRDQIPAKLADKLDEMNVGDKVVKTWEMADADRQDWLNRQQTFLKDWDEFLTSTAEGPFNGASSLHIPMPLQVAKALHARFLQAAVGIEPYFTLKPRREDAVERAQMVTDTMHYTLKDWCNYRQGAEAVLDGWIWDWITTGNGIAKLGWDCQYSSYIDVVEEPEQRFQIVVDPETNQEIEVPVVEMVEREKRVTKKIFEGPVMKRLEIEDFIMVGGEGDPQQADFVGEQYWLSASEMWQLVDRKLFREKQTQEVIASGEDRKGGATGSALKDERKTNNGRSQLDFDADLDRYRIIEAYLKLDVDGSGINSDVVVWVHYRTKKILRATYLQRINKAGERPYFKIDFHRRAGQDYGIGIVEIIHPLSKEMDAMHNLRIDYGMISTMPFGFYRPTSSIDPKIIELEPGALIPVDNPSQDVYFPNLGNRTAFGFQEEAALQTMVERITGINDLSLGVISGAQGATRTATGARALLGESNANLDVFLRRFGRGWRQALQYLLHMLQQRIPVGLSFRVTGESGSDYWAQIKSQADIAGEFDFEVSQNSANSNRAIQQEVTQSVLTLVMNPLLIQTGAVNTGNIFEAVKEYLKSLGIKDWGRYVTKPPQWQHNLSPEDEANRLLRGIPVPVTPEMDHQGFIDYFNFIEGSDELLGQFSVEQTKVLAAQVQKHAQMLQALEAQAAQAANTQQMQINGAQSQQQASPGMSPMQGIAQPNGAQAA